MFIVSAEVFPMSKKTARFRAKAQRAFKSSKAGGKSTLPSLRSGMTFPASIFPKKKKKTENKRRF